jgi:hypothetical protein
MRKVRGALVACVAAGAWLAASCTEASSPTAPAFSHGSAQTSLLGGLLNVARGLLVSPLQRKQPLADDVSWSFYAGPGGATSSNSAVGLTVSIPSGALATTTKITVTALAGSAVAYGFEPHLTFAKNVTLTQDLRVTSYGLLNQVLSGAHFTGDDLTLTSDGLALVDELVGAPVNPLTQTTSFGVGHFSGWIVASGKSSDGSGQ